MAPKVKRFGARYFKTTAFRRGVMGTSRGWFAVWVAVTGFGMVKRRLGRSEDVVYRTVLRPGERLQIGHHAPAPKAARRRRRGGP